jgi:hypothetical protein
MVTDWAEILKDAADVLKTDKMEGIPCPECNTEARDQEFGWKCACLGYGYLTRVELTDAMRGRWLFRAYSAGLQVDQSFNEDDIPF